MVKMLLRITSVLSRRLGGVLFVGQEIDLDGNLTDPETFYHVKVAGSLNGPFDLDRGVWASVDGSWGKDFFDKHVGHRKTIEASYVELIMPSGQHIIEFLQSKHFTGIGESKARRLWEAFSDQLFDILDRKDVERLTGVLTRSSAQALVEDWAEFGFVSEQMRWLQEIGIPPKLGVKLLNHFKQDLKALLTEDPYAILSFTENWKLADKIALEQFKLLPFDERRISAAIREALCASWAEGHTYATAASLERAVRSKLTENTTTQGLGQVMTRSTEIMQGNEHVLIDQHNNAWLIGCAVLEQFVARNLVERMTQGKDDISEAISIIDKFERGAGFELTKEQRQAILTCAQNPFSLMTGGAGVGKTTVLECLIEVLKNQGYKVRQMALSGKAAKRMVEATGEPAITIASYLSVSSEASAKDNEEREVIIIDEASMVDLISFGRFLDVTPKDSKLILVGDPNQIMPVGPGLILHELAKIEEIPHAKLTAVKRYAGAVLELANSIQNGLMCELSENQDESVSFVSCDDKQAQQKCIDLFLRDPDISQILCSTKNGKVGVHELNRIIQSALTGANEKLHVPSYTFDDMPAYTGFNLNDRIICNSNHWELGLQNGSTGVVCEIIPISEQNREAQGLEEDQEVAVARVCWDDGVIRGLPESLLEDISLAYAITTHRSQGSQWPNVIIPVVKSRILDRNLLYTAVTRTRQNVYLLGDKKALEDAIVTEPQSEKRRTKLALRIQKLLLQMSEAQHLEAVA